MSDTAERDAVLAEFKRPYFGLPDTYALIDEIVRLRDENTALTAAVERVRMAHKCGCPSLRALEGTP